VRVQRWQTGARSESKLCRCMRHRPGQGFARGNETERSCWDPKGGELCLGRVKPGETLVEARSGSDVQIDRQTWV
jgi:hypothetical protein